MWMPTRSQSSFTPVPLTTQVPVQNRMSFAQSMHSDLNIIRREPAGDQFPNMHHLQDSIRQQQMARRHSLLLAPEWILVSESKLWNLTHDESNLIGPHWVCFMLDLQKGSGVLATLFCGLQQTSL